MTRATHLALVGALFLLSVGPASAQECAVMPIGQQDEILAAAGLEIADRRSLASDLGDLRSAAALLEHYGQTEACAAIAEALAAIVANPTIVQDRTRQAFLTAVPFAVDGGTVADLLDRSLIALSGQEVGRVKDLWIDANGQPSLIVVSLRGPLGIGVGTLAVPPSLVHVAEDGVVYLGLTSAEIGAAPRVEDSAVLADAEWRAGNAAFYSGIIEGLAR